MLTGPDTPLFVPDPDPDHEFIAMRLKSPSMGTFSLGDVARHHGWPDEPALGSDYRPHRRSDRDRTRRE